MFEELGMDTRLEGFEYVKNWEGDRDRWNNEKNNQNGEYVWWNGYGRYAVWCLKVEQGLRIRRIVVALLYKGKVSGRIIEG